MKVRYSFSHKEEHVFLLIIIASEYLQYSGNHTGKSVSEALILDSPNPQYDKRLLIDLLVLTQKLQAQNMLCTYIVFCFVFDIQNNVCTHHVMSL